MQLLTPLALAGGLLALPVILLYMLRLRRQEIEVSSIMLWQQLLQDTEANTPCSACAATCCCCCNC